MNVGKLCLIRFRLLSTPETTDLSFVIIFFPSRCTTTPVVPSCSLTVLS